ncbi:alcohol dehydrogenase catalytic domain-containing protein [Plantactinospora sp. KLBMP9567]|uniref:alcohol dehydrogenase catalytic domain-containing protein n=1 Tax=Plantactinospora sp. KLBMP9567 TaxID=3085900 RepID=UPI00298239E2|nr:alcohol dehydrogenase catalytic domain-containing protein [Plantactinospora sp. KLBMP9567]MDW5329539.1 alcohol dehydrogenase catalytic domain-containing protein [Plantactinospora sp. KLBMP9567]
MRGVVFRGPRELEVVTDLPEPAVRGPRDAVVRVTRSAICGSDLHPYRGGIPDFAPGTVLGHEFVGVVVDAGAEVPFAAGDRVSASDVIACGRCARCARGWHYHCPEATLFGYSTVVGPAVPGGQAEYVRVPFADVVLAACPPELSDEQMVFVGDLLSTACAAATAAVVPGDLTTVVGGGALGQLSAMCARAFGAAHVVLADPEPVRREDARALGFEAVEPGRLAAALDRHGGAAGVIEAVGSDSALATAVGAAAPRAIIAVVGAHSSRAMPLATQTAFTRELTLTFIVGDPIRDRARAVALLRSGALDPTAVISHRLHLTEAVDGYRLFDRREALKVVLQP